MDDDSVDHFLRGKKLILTRNYLFYKSSNFFNLFENIYKVYDPKKA